ncbi:MAG: dienelactone hydrolase family protein, partial [Alphaproteobacteria bacterium]
YADDFAAVAALYGTRMVTDKPDSPHLLAGKVKGELYLGFAEEDQHVPDNVVPDLRAALDAAGATYRIETYEGTRHGFSFPRRWCYDRAAAEKAQAIILDLFARRLVL